MGHAHAVGLLTLQHRPVAASSRHCASSQTATCKRVLLYCQASTCIHSPHKLDASLQRGNGRTQAHHRVQREERDALACLLCNNKTDPESADDQCAWRHFDTLQKVQRQIAVFLAAASAASAFIMSLDFKSPRRRLSHALIFLQTDKMLSTGCPSSHSSPETHAQSGRAASHQQPGPGSVRRGHVPLHQPFPRKILYSALVLHRSHLRLQPRCSVHAVPPPAWREQRGLTLPAMQSLMHLDLPAIQIPELHRLVHKCDRVCAEQM